MSAALSAPQSTPRAGIAALWALLGEVPDPEIPVLSIIDLGIVRHVRLEDDGRLHVGLTPTYSGCPATEVICASVRAALDRGGFATAVVEQVLSPPWSSGWLSAAGREKLRAFGIAPPAELAPMRIACPRCAGTASERLSEFGSTPCKAHYRCLSCGEPFDYFKCL